MEIKPEWLYSNRRVKPEFFTLDNFELDKTRFTDQTPMREVVLACMPHYVVVPPPLQHFNAPHVVAWLSQNVTCWFSWSFPIDDSRRRDHKSRHYYCFASEDDALLFKLTWAGQ